MSGGSWDYVDIKFTDVGKRLLSEKCPYRRALGKIVLDIAKAMHEIEWVDSSDMGPGDEMESIMKVVQKADSLKVLIEDATKIRDDINLLLKESG